MTVDLKIFDVEHGACALLTADNNARMMIDCGHNGDTGWRPGTYLKGQGVTALEMLTITNYDEDHASGSVDLFDNIDVRWLTRNKSVSPGTLRSLKSEDGMGTGIDRLVYEIEHTFTGGGASQPPVFSGVERKAFWNDYPTFDDENNLSLVLFLKCHGIGILFPGDLEKAGWVELLKDQNFQQALRETKVLIASHHGRENGCCKEVFDYYSPFYIVISDKGYMYDTQRTSSFYSQYARGGPFRSETRRILTTRNDGRIGFNFAPEKWAPY